VLDVTAVNVPSALLVVASDAPSIELNQK
jgi:hypothetical protein